MTNRDTNKWLGKEKNSSSVNVRRGVFSYYSNKEVLCIG
ncbi:hypothetical protein B4166_0223 [Caldibacillus thermoamylovorans]|uniref:Uncharacterized protein n=1 Tax=Caldibacillus thermoamylovorans TaxID=35841 RepID=A0ABD4A3D9_9BACI|nr:hypothetical protein B4166_0223 [Caldibacillus thermoamylovorans]KIO71232.1 hypothetical protein B4167_0186 [Caldibacillus thermoamylovorans]